MNLPERLAPIEASVAESLWKCWFSHKWSKWQVVTLEKWQDKPHMICNERMCLRCGLLNRRRIGET
jgi:hypothetical protein